MKKFFLLYLFYLYCTNFAYGQIQRIKLDDHIILGTSIFKEKAAINTFQKEALLYKKEGKDFVFFQTIPKDNIDFLGRSLLPIYNQEIIVPCNLTDNERGIITYKLANDFYIPIDTFVIDSHSNILRYSFIGDWLISNLTVDTFNQQFESSTFDIFYKRKNNKWVPQDSFESVFSIFDDRHLKTTHYRITDQFAIAGEIPDISQNTDFSGYIIVYELKDGKWRELSLLQLPEEPALKNIFGRFVSISPDNRWIAISSMNIFQTNTEWVVYIYKFKGNDFVLNSKIADYSSSYEDRYYSFFSIVEDELLIGMPFENGKNGIIRYYKYDGLEWVRGRDIHPPAWDSEYEKFGFGLERDGEWVITSAFSKNGSNNLAYIFRIPARDSFDVIMCEGEGFAIGDRVYYESGIYQDTLISSYGVDSIIWLNLKITQHEDVVIDTMICKNGGFEFGGEEITQPGSYLFTFIDKNGCDSIVELNVSIFPSHEVNVDTLICEGKSIEINGQIIDAAGQYIFDLNSIYGCDSTLVLNVNLSRLDLINTEILPDLGCDSGGIKIEVEGDNQPFTYIWKDGRSGPEINSVSAGQYELTIQNALGCEFTYDFLIPDSIPYLIPEAFIPDHRENDAYNTFWIYIGDKSQEKGRVELVKTEIYNRWGEKLFFSEGTEFWDGTFRGIPQPGGVYLYRVVIRTPCGTKTEKGQLLLLR